MIEILKEQPLISIANLAEAMKLSKKSTRNIMDRLKSKSLINREGGRKYGKGVVEYPAVKATQEEHINEEAKP